jgi:hypothetical protein
MSSVGSGRGRAMRRCSFAGPPPMIADAIEVDWWEDEDNSYDLNAMYVCVQSTDKNRCIDRRLQM